MRTGFETSTPPSDRQTHNGRMDGCYQVPYLPASRLIYIFCYWILGHADNDIMVPYHRITTMQGRVLLISGRHLLPVNSEKNLIPAEQVQIGDVLFTETGQEVVKNMEIVIKRGAFCPHTTGKDKVEYFEIKKSSFISSRTCEFHRAWLQQSDKKPKCY